MKKIIMVLLSLSFLVGMSFAAKNTKDKSEKKVKPYPNGCVPVGYKFLHGTLNLFSVVKDKKQAIFFIHNTSKQTVQFLQTRDGMAPYIMHNNNKLKPGRWAVYASDLPNAKFICTKATKKHLTGEVLDCEKLLKVCQYPKVKFATNNRGNYWATTNQGQRSSVRAVIYQGVLLKWGAMKDPSEN